MHSTNDLGEENSTINEVLNTILGLMYSPPKEVCRAVVAGGVHSQVLLVVCLGLLAAC